MRFLNELRPSFSRPPLECSTRPMIGLLGVVVDPGSLAWAVSDRPPGALNPRLLAWGLGLQM